MDNYICPCCFGANPFAWTCTKCDREAIRNYIPPKRLYEPHYVDTKDQRGNDIRIDLGDYKDWDE